MIHRTIGSYVCFADDFGRVVKVDRKHDGTRAFLSVRFSLAELYSSDPQNFSTLCILNEIDCPILGLIIVCGEGSWGTDGFVAAIDRYSNELNWLLFSDRSNP